MMIEGKFGINIDTIMYSNDEFALIKTNDNAICKLLKNGDCIELVKNNKEDCYLDDSYYNTKTYKSIKLNNLSHLGCCTFWILKKCNN